MRAGYEIEGRRLAAGHSLTRPRIRRTLSPAMGNLPGDADPKFFEQRDLAGNQRGPVAPQPVGIGCETGKVSRRRARVEEAELAHVAPAHVVR